MLNFFKFSITDSQISTIQMITWTDIQILNFFHLYDLFVSLFADWLKLNM
jgi:hypothetical protein